MMDPKASAKAKRSYSQQGRRNHPSPAAIAQKKKAAGVGSERKVQRAFSRGLPSNFDRYDDVEDQAESSSGTKLEEGEIAPKSKGADYAYLIEQARSQQLELRAPTVPESASFFDELTTDFMKGVSSIHTVRRKNLLSRCEDDNFVVDDDLTSSFEIPFLNLDFHAIAAQLSKLKLSERLFIEEDLLPEDLRSDDSKGSSSSVQSEKNEAIEMGLNLAAPDSYLYSFPNPKVSQAYPAQGNDQQTAVGENLGQQNGKREAEESPANISEISPLKIGEAEAELDMLLESFKETSLSGSIQGDNKPASRIPFDESLPFDWKSASQNPSYVIRKPPADAELDTLLDSSKENNLSGAIHGGRLDHSSNSRVPDSDFLYTMHQQSSDRIQFSSKNVATASIDDSIDDLLAETSSVLQKRKHTRALALAPELGSMPSTANLSHPHSGSSSIDDLLGVASSNPGSGVQMDDFDSWMDSF